MNDSDFANDLHKPQDQGNSNKPKSQNQGNAGKNTSRHQGHKARKRFGQNFLINESLITEIAQSIEPNAKDHIIEIGPGLGAITQQLSESGALLTLIELDRDLVARLQTKYKQAIENDKLIIVNEDVLQVDLAAIINTTPERTAKLIGNLPYNISTPVLFHILDHHAHFDVMTFMLQKEVVDRISASPATSAYSALSVILQLQCDIEKLFDVPPESFQPAPKVDSAVVQLRQKKQILIDQAQLPEFRQFVHSCFQQRRKTLRNNLKKIMPVTAIEFVGINPQHRPEHLTLEEFVKLFQYYTFSEK